MDEDEGEGEEEAESGEGEEEKEERDTESEIEQGEGEDDGEMDNGDGSELWSEDGDCSEHKLASAPFVLMTLTFTFEVGEAMTPSCTMAALCSSPH